MRYVSILAAAGGLLSLFSNPAAADYSVHSALHRASSSGGSGVQTFGALDDILGGMAEPDMEEVESNPLGSQGNPVRCDMPRGERAYLRRLRCENKKAPTFERLGSDGFSPWEQIMDIYEVQCSMNTKAPKTFSIYMDMYHADYVERRAVEGFTIVRPR